ncbi:aspartyl protease family protein [Stenotrophomonas aracearum]|uniref:Aspartyl protease family protein n=1 Tax=Stenotrophomonas aracearum TaxID=3003272 RepID=A0ABY9YE00_9GAMM|nr:aspartyl protease family protein [Stenotrophomonas sp. A5588]WNH49107.1 aspartyl protease family protein [Stenotrophomonas sp. A5588]
MHPALPKLLSLLVLLPAAAASASPPATGADACGLAHQPIADALVQVPFESIDGRIYVQARVNGQGPYRFAVDTGASGIGRADMRLVTALDLPRHGETTTSDGVTKAGVDTVRLDALELGDAVHRNVEVIARDYNARNAPEAAFDGILARDFFADGLLRIDYPNKTLAFTRALKLDPAAANALAYTRAFRIPVSVGTHTFVAQLDTGANVGFVLPQSAYEQVSEQPLGEAVLSQLTNGQLESWRGTVQQPIRVGQVSQAQAEVRVSPKYPEVLVGARALQNAVVLIDQRSQVVAVCR